MEAASVLLRHNAVQFKVRSTFGFKWTEKATLDMVTMFNAGKTLTEIGEKYGVKRGAIAGVISRVKKAGILTVKDKLERPKPVKEKPQKATPEIPIAPKIAQPEPIKKEKKKRIRLTLITDEFQVTIDGLQSHHCRYPIGDPRQPEFRYCGRFQYGNGPYCLEHQQLCYVPPHLRYKYKR